MTCPSELSLLLLSEGGLPEQEAAPLAGHVARCADCSGRLAALRVERQAIAVALVREPELADLPAFERPVSRGSVAVAVAMLALVGAALSVVPGWLGDAVPAPLSWFSPLDRWGLADLLARASIFLFERGDTLMTILTETVAAGVVVSLVVWGVIALRRHPRGPLLLMALAFAAVTLPEPAHAVEIRRADNGTVLISADETISDTLIAFGETVEVVGDVEGDLIAFGRRVAIRGRVGGVVIAGAASVSIDGEAQGSVFGFGRTLDVSPLRIGGNLYGFGAVINAQRRIDGNAVVFGQQVSLGGPVGRDVVGFAEELEVGNVVEGSLTAYANRVALLAPARIAGNVTVHIPREEHLTVSPGAVVGGELTTDIATPPEGKASEYASVGFYVGQVLRFAAAFVTGVLLLALVPSLRRASLRSPGNVLVAGGVGLVALVATPIIAVLVAITIVGLPLALMGLVLWLALLYLSKVVLAHVIGARLLELSERPRGFVVALTVGLLAIIVVVNLPFIGGVIDFLLTICGFGLIVLFLWNQLRAEPQEPAYG